MCCQSLRVFFQDGFERRNDSFEILLDTPVVLDETELPVGLSGSDEFEISFRLILVHTEELDGGLEVRTGKAGVRMRALLLLSSRRHSNSGFLQA